MDQVRLSRRALLAGTAAAGAAGFAATPAFSQVNWKKYSGTKLEAILAKELVSTTSSLRFPSRRVHLVPEAVPARRRPRVDAVMRRMRPRLFRLPRAARVGRFSLLRFSTGHTRRSRKYAARKAVIPLVNKCERSEVLLAVIHRPNSAQRIGLCPGSALAREITPSARCFCC